MLSNNRYLYIVLFIFFFSTSIINMGCMEKRSNAQNSKQNNKSIEFLSNICFNEELFKYLDSSVFYLVGIGIIIHLCSNSI